MHLSVIQQHPVPIKRMRLVLNPIEILVIIEMIMHIINNPPPDIVQNHVSIVVKVIFKKKFFPQQFKQFVSFVCSLLYD
jgi:hypothetical protein